MFKPEYYKPVTTLSLTMTLSMAIISPLVSFAPASAQLFPEQQRNQDIRENRDYRDNRDDRDNRRVSSTIIIPAGTQIPLEFEKDSDRNTLIPYGTQVEGQIEPAGEGSRFVAQELIFEDDTRQSLDATSEVVTRTETVKRGTDTGDVLKGAAIGGAAAAVLGEIFGDINIEEVIGGAALGALGGWILGRDRVELISIDPNQDLDITLNSDLALR
jgi:hypothetical protein